MTEAIEETPRPTSASKAPAVESATATEVVPIEAANAEAEPAEDANLEKHTF
jgi:DNA-binding transcriptional regulator YdaS (Cro superfamily)